MARGHIFMQTGPCTMGIGSKMNSTGMAWSSGPMVQNMRANMIRGENMERVSSFSLKDRTMMVSSRKTKFVEEESITGLMESIMKDNGKKTRCTDLVF